MGAGESKLASSVAKGDLSGVLLALKAGEDADCNNKGDCTPLHKASEAGYHNIAVALIEAKANIHAKDKRYKSLRYEPLHFAAENGHKDIATLLICAGASHSSTTALGDQAIHLAIRRNHQGIVSILIEAGTGLYTTDSTGKLPLHIAVEKGYLQIVQLLVNANVDISRKDNDDNHVIHLATQNNHLNIVSALIAASADVSVKNGSGKTPLHIAVEKGNVQIVQTLVDAGADISAKDENGDQAHHVAAANGQIKIMDILLTSGADTSDFNTKGNQAIHLAAKNGHHIITSSLLSAGADFTTPNWQGNTAAHIAAIQGYTDILKVLKKHGDDFAALSSNDKKCTPLHSATENGHMNTVQWLVRNGASLKKRNGARMTAADLAKANFRQAISNWFDHVKEQQNNVLEYAKKGDFHSVMSALDVGANASSELLYYAVLAGKAHVVQAAISLGTSVEKPTFFFRYRPLHHAAERGYPQVVKELLKAGADHMAIEYRGRTAAHIAACAGHKQVLEVLKEHGGNLQAASSNRFHWTPLHYAASEGHLSIVKWLVRNGGDPSARDSFGNTPCKCASDKHQKDVVWWLLFDAEHQNEMNESSSASLTDEEVANEEDSKIPKDTNKSKSTWSNNEQGNSEIPEICYSSVEDTCSDEAKGCQRLHSNRHYHWQVKEPFGYWLNLPKNQVDCLELAFCDPSKDGINLPLLDVEEVEFSLDTLKDIMGNGSWRSNFQDMTLADPSNRRVLKLRRLCSEKIDGKPVKPGPYLWYFLDKNKKWVKYGNVDTAREKNLVCNITSSDIENLFNENPSQTIHFQNTQYQYTLDFETMMQRNISTNVCRDVRRRPQPHEIKPCGRVDKNHKSDNLGLPSLWEDMENSERLRRVELLPNSQEYHDICNSLLDAVNPSNVEKIERIQNPYLWFAFQNKIREMTAVYGSIYEVNVCQLFHGTDASVVDKICDENFDWRLHGTNTGQMYGRGTYFSPNAKTAYAYCKSDAFGRYNIFLAQVAVGTCVVGNPGMVRPPTNPSTNKLYDSTVDADVSPKIIVKYDKQEYYPEYVVTVNHNPFRRRNANGNASCIVS